MEHLLNHLKHQESAMLATLRRFVEQESPSTDKAAVDQFGATVAAELRAAGATVKVHRSAKSGNHLQADWFRSTRAGSSGKGLLLLGHLDTVWPLGTLRTMPFAQKSGRAYGPGIYDMKAGIVIGIFAMRCLREMGWRSAKPVSFLLTSDEEIGSPTSRVLILQLARRSSAALVLEPSYGAGGALKTARKGVGEFRIHVKGRAAHSGLDPKKGASAVVELARQIIAIKSLENLSRGITLNPGVIRGGTRSNVVAAEAEAVIDLRVRKQSDAERIGRVLRALKPNDRRTTIKITGGMNRPPFERTEAGDELLRLARRLARPLGIQLQQAAVGGGSDGNFTSAAGTPTLDGLGAVGDGAHADHENVLVSELPRRTALLASLIQELGSR